MIQHFAKIQNLGVFSDYTKPVDMKPFQKFNLIYGLNGSGKTTLSRFFADLNLGMAEGFPDLKYKINAKEGDFQQGQPYTCKIRVFNAEYVDENIGKLDGKLNPIYVIGKENKALAENVATDELKLLSLEKLLYRCYSKI
ncbi:MAG: AAA family ATPase, partial [Yoonia sp.]|nr:AAA family ATPase [Yoonia sp.]